MIHLGGNQHNGDHWTSNASQGHWIAYHVCFHLITHGWIGRLGSQQQLRWNTFLCNVPGHKSTSTSSPHFCTHLSNDCCMGMMMQFPLSAHRVNLSMPVVSHQQGSG